MRLVRWRGWRDARVWCDAWGLVGSRGVVVTNLRVILITASGPGGNQVDVGVRSDATPAELVMSIGNVLGVGLVGTIAEHHAPPRPGVPRGARTRLDFNRPLAASGVVDGDMIIFANRAGPRAPGRSRKRAGLAHQASRGGAIPRAGVTRCARRRAELGGRAAPGDPAQRRPAGARRWAAAPHRPLRRTRPGARWTGPRRWTAPARALGPARAVDRPAPAGLGPRRWTGPRGPPGRWTGPRSLASRSGPGRGTGPAAA